MSNARFSILQARAVKDKSVSDAQFRTLAALGMYADEDGWCFPSLTTLGKDLHKSKQAVGRDTIHLRKLGYLEVTARFDEKTGARRSSMYRLKFDLPPLDASTPSTNHVDGYSTNKVDGASTSEVDVNDPIKRPKRNDPNRIIINPITAQLFIDAFGTFYGKKEQTRWEVLYDSVGPDRANDIIAWASKKEIHLTNRPGLLDSLETAATNWKEKPGKKQSAAQSEDRDRYVTGQYAEYIR